ncbi:MAG: hypothetical protein ACPLGZ_00330 [Candidatus Pelagibacter ubique]
MEMDIMIFKGGHSYYGQVLGILVFESTIPRIPGDPGNALTFNFPVCYEIIEGQFSDLVDGSEKVRENLIKAAKNLENKGVKAIIGDCGLMSIYQRDVSSNLNIPFVSSSLLLLPLIWLLHGEKGKIGIITGHSKYLQKKHLDACGAGNIPVEIQGMEEKDEFCKVVLKGNDTLNFENMKNDVLKAVEELLKRKEGVHSILLECSNLCSFSKDIRERFRLPVYDIIAAIELIKYTIWPVNYSEIMKKYNLL